MTLRRLALCALVIAAGCAHPRAGAPAAPCCTREAFSNALTLVERHRNPGITERRVTPAQLWSAVDASLGSPALRTETIGQSILGRDIRAITFGSGRTRVLMWSQMHGDESTAASALVRTIGPPTP